MSTPEPIYDRIGEGYVHSRRSEPRIAAAIDVALRTARSVVNVGAGAGSYEPRGRDVVAIEPSSTMIAQRPSGSATAIRATAAHLPFRDRAFDAALAVLTVHHWPGPDRIAGLREMGRVARDGVVVLTWDPSSAGFWLVEDYLPEVLAIDRRIFPPLAEFEAALGPVAVLPLPIPHDCADGFLGAFWRRPHAYLDRGIQRAISTFTKVRDLDAGLERLRADLESGRFAARHAELLAREELDIGYRLVVSGKLAAARTGASS
jgi:SAM-dependent methyltransferase